MRQKDYVFSAGPLVVRYGSVDGHWFLSLSGELDLSNIDAVEHILDQAFADSAAGIILVDIERLDFIDSVGISLLLRAMRRDQSYSRLGVRPARSPAVLRALDIAGVGPLIDARSTVQSELPQPLIHH